MHQPTPPVRQRQNLGRVSDRSAAHIAGGADRTEGPWVHARKIITHANKLGDAHDFYNPTQHSFLDREDGRVIYLEGSYVNTFSGNPHPTPYYEYNQIRYPLDLSDPRLRLPEGPAPRSRGSGN